MYGLKLSQKAREITRFRTRLADFHKQTADILREAGFDPKQLEEADKEPQDEPLGVEKHRDLYAFRVFDVDSDLPNAQKLNDATEPASAAYRMLRFIRLMQELIDEKGVDILTVIYAFELGSVFKHAELGMQFAEIAHAFLTRENKSRSKKPRPNRIKNTRKWMVRLFAQWCVDNKKTPTFANVIAAMESEAAQDAIENRNAEPPPFLIDSVDREGKKVFLLSRQDLEENLNPLSFETIKSYLKRLKL
jgi:hypothetical protein